MYIWSKKDMTYKNRNKFADHIDFNKEQPFVFNYFNETKNKLSKFEREISRETSLNKKKLTGQKYSKLFIRRVIYLIRFSLRRDLIIKI